MHNDPKKAEEILSGKNKFWDLGQAEFLLNPLEREQPNLFDAMDLMGAYKKQCSK